MAEKPVYLDFETEAIEPRPEYPPSPVGVSLRWPNQRKSRYLAWEHPTGNNCSKAEAKVELQKVWDSGLPVAMHNAKFDLAVATEKLGLPMLPWPRSHDTMVLAYLVDPHAKKIGLKELAESRLGLPPTERDEVHEWLIAHGIERRGTKKWGRSISKAPGDLVGRYAAGDTDRTKLILESLLPEVQSAGMQEAYDRERRLIPVLLANEQQGVCVDLGKLEADVELYDQALAKVDDLLFKRLKAAPFNLNSDEELADALDKAFPSLSWPLTPTGKRSTSKESLTEVVGTLVPDLVALFTYRATISTCVNTFMRPWLETAQRTGGRIHTQWNSVAQSEGGGTRTGRLSSSPNFQNIPTLKSAGFVKAIELWKVCLKHLGFPPLPAVRSYIVADDDDSVLVDFDFSQQELRVMAHFEDGQLAEAYRQNPTMDLHEFAAKLITEATGIPVSRKAAKTCVAEGSLVLTQLGLVPIEEITSLHLVWDGVEWVSHTGVVYQGERDVIEYQGLVATTDHEVWTKELGKVQVGVAAAKRATLVKTGQGWHAIQYLESAEQHNLEETGKTWRPGQVLLGCTMPEVRCSQMDLLREYTAGSFDAMPQLLDHQTQTFKGTWRQIQCDLTALQHAALSWVSMVRRTWHKMQVQNCIGIYTIHCNAAPIGQLPRPAHRQDKQRWTLRAWEFAVSDKCAEFQKHLQNTTYRVQRSTSSGKPSLASIEDRLPNYGVRPWQDCQALNTGPKLAGDCRSTATTRRRAKVYDITNAGPRHRFTVSNVLVSNCAFGLLYGMGLGSLAERLGVTVEEAKRTKKAYLDTFPGIGEIQDDLKFRGKNGLPMTTWGGRRYLAEPPRVINGVRRDFYYKLFNCLIQGSSSDITKEAVLRYDATKQHGRLLLTVHDQITISVPKKHWKAEAKLLRTSMEGVRLDVPLLADGGVGYRWTELQDF